MRRFLAMGWAPIITVVGWGTGAIQKEVHEGVNRKLSGSGSQTYVHMYVCNFIEAHTYIHRMSYVSD